MTVHFQPPRAVFSGLSPRQWAIAALAAGLALLASWQRIVIAPGFELYAGTFFYLLAYQTMGQRAALLVAAAVLAPSLLWWGHPYTLVHGLLFVALLPLLIRLTGSLTFAALAFSLTGGLVISILLVHVHYGAPPIILGTTFVRKTLNDVAQAAAVELLCALFEIRLLPPVLRLRRRFRLLPLVHGFMMLTIMISAMLLFIGQASSFPFHIASYQSELKGRLQLVDRALHGAAAAGAHPVTVEVSRVGQARAVIAPPGTAFTPAHMRWLGCTRVDDGNGRGPNDRNTFVYWLSACQTGTLTVSGQQVRYLYTSRLIAQAEYGRLLAQMGWVATLMLFAIAMQMLVLQSVRRSVGSWNRVVDGFGKPSLVQPEGRIFTEIDVPIRQFIATNNRYVEILSERQRLIEAMEELRGAVDLKLVSGLRFNPANQRLQFETVSLSGRPVAEAMRVHPQDAAVLAEGLGRADPMIEFRIEGTEDWHLLVARGPRSDGSWASGCILKLRQAQFLDDRMRQQALLIELGGMASALSHELKQPLFTMLLSAENGLLLSEQEPAPLPALRAKFARILEQVERARDIIGRISHYSRTEDPAQQGFDAHVAIRNCIRFLRPLFVQHDVRLRLELAPEAAHCRGSQIGFEQVVVNALNNATDAIVARRAAEGAAAPAEITITTRVEGGQLHLEVVDSGIGLPEALGDRLFEAFTTSKPDGQGTGLGLYISRQILLEMGGRTAIAPNPAGGAIFTADLPLDGPGEVAAIRMEAA